MYKSYLIGCVNAVFSFNSLISIHETNTPTSLFFFFQVFRCWTLNSLVGSVNESLSTTIYLPFWWFLTGFLCKELSSQSSHFFSPLSCQCSLSLSLIILELFISLFRTTQTAFLCKWSFDYKRINNIGNFFLSFYSINIQFIFLISYITAWNLRKLNTQKKFILP